MTSRNPAVDMMLADLRHELLAPPSESVAAEHVAVLRLEHELLTSGPSDARRAIETRATVKRSLPQRARARIQRETSTRSRRIAALVATLSVLSGTVGLNAAGALPGTLRHISDHITNSIVHTFDVPQPAHSRSSARTSSARAATAGTIGNSSSQRVALGPVGARWGSTTSTGDVYTPPSTTQPSVNVAQAPGVTQQGTGGAPGSPGSSGTTSGPTQPPDQTMKKDPRTPPGFPVDWRDSAIDAARAQLGLCARAVVLAPVGCPQQAFSTTAPTAVHWTILNQPLAGAAALAQAATNASPGQPVTYQVFVYGLFQMDAAYTVGGDPSHLHYAYSGGIAQATMNWNGSMFVSVSFATGPYTQQVPSGAGVPAFLRPAAATDSAVLAAVQAGFAACATASSAPDASIANCPQYAPVDTAATSGQWSLVGDPIPGSSVTFDPAHGDFTVSGGFAMNLVRDDGTTVPVTSQYTATLAFDGTALRLLSIAPA